MKLALAIAAAAATLFAGNALAAKDNFDRADLGSKWVVTSPNLYIVDNALQGDSLGAGYFKRAASANQVTATVTLTSTDLQYGAILVGDIAGGTNAFVKLQAQDGSGNFSHGAFYVGNNGGGSFFNLDAPVASPAKLTVTVNGSIVQLKIDSASGPQSYAYDYGYTIGTGGGLGTYGMVRIDNLRAKAVAVGERGTAPTQRPQAAQADLSR